MLRLATRWDRPTEMIGWECQVFAEDLGLGPATLATKSGPSTGILRRPPAEIALCAFWENLKQWDLRAPIMGAFIEGLLGQPAELRTGPIYTSPNRSSVVLEFPSADGVKCWRHNLQRTSELDLHPFLFALYAMVLVIIQHPYQDGNGRLSRAIFQGALAHKGLIKAPILPLGPSLHMSKHGMAAALIDLAQSGCWTTYANTYAASCVQMLARLLQRPIVSDGLAGRRA